jgi:hypothetical protein
MVGFRLPAGLSSSTASGSGRLTPPTMPIAFPLHVPSVTFSPNFASLSIAADNFVDDSFSLCVIFTPFISDPEKPLQKRGFNGSTPILNISVAPFRVDLAGFKDRTGGYHHPLGFVPGHDSRLVVVGRLFCPQLTHDVD